MENVQIGLTIHIKLILFEHKIFNKLKKKSKLINDCFIKCDHFIFYFIHKAQLLYVNNFSIYLDRGSDLLCLPGNTGHLYT